MSYSLPGGGTCELRLWGFTFSPQADAPEGVAFDSRPAELARNFAATADIAKLMDVPSVIAENRSGENGGLDENGLLTRYGYGTDRYDADVE